jgi:hypothetical protein
LFRYPSKYIDIHFRKFFGEYASISSITPLIDDENQFLTMRTKLLAQPSGQELQVAHRIANAEAKEYTNNENTVSTMATTTSKQDKANKFDNTLFTHYKH